MNVYVATWNWNTEQMGIAAGVIVAHIRTKMNNIKEITEYLEQQCKDGYLLIVAPKKEDSNMYGMFKFNPGHRMLFEDLERLIKKYAVWSGGGSMN